jgi:20S proteasome alpha/beta subunit
MECLIGLVGGDYAMIAADMNAGRSIMVFNQEADRIMEMDSHKLLGVCGDPADCVNEPQFFQKNLNLYALRNAEKQLSTHATANYMRGEKSANLRKGMKQVDMLLCGFDEGKGPSLYFIDYLASMQKLNVAGHGYGGMFVNSLLDAHWKEGMTEEEGMHLMKLCIAEINTRFMINMPNWVIKVVDKNGVRTVRKGPAAAAPAS